MSADLLFVEHGGALWLLSPATPAGQAWISANLSGARRWGADSFVIAPCGMWSITLAQRMTDCRTRIR